MTKYIDKTPLLDKQIIRHLRSYIKGHQIGTHAHSQAQLLYSTSGLMNVTTPTGRFLIPPQRAVWIPPTIEHSVDVLTNVEMRSVYLEPTWLKKHQKKFNLTKIYVINVNPLMREIILAIHSENDSEEKIDLLMNLALFEIAQAKDPTTYLPIPTDLRAKKVAQLALDDIQSIKSFEDLCYEANTTNRTITRLFTKETKLSFREWRQRARIMNAITLLGDRNISMKQVAIKIGFSSTASFAYAFKQVMNMTPTEFSSVNK